MAKTERDVMRKAENRLEIMRAGYRLFVRRTIDGVSLEEVADASGFGVATVYRYFGNKMELVIAISVWKWEDFWKKYIKKQDRLEDQSGASRFGFYLDSYLELYRKHRDLLRFNQFFNVYIQGSKKDQKRAGSFEKMVRGIAERFNAVWEQGKQDGTLRAEIPWQSVFSATLHIMMAAVTRYAVGLMYSAKEGADPEEELVMLRNLLYRQYVRE